MFYLAILHTVQQLTSWKNLCIPLWSSSNTLCEQTNQKSEDFNVCCAFPSTTRNNITTSKTQQQQQYVGKCNWETGNVCVRVELCWTRRRRMRSRRRRAALGNCLFVCIALYLSPSLPLSLSLSLSRPSSLFLSVCRWQHVGDVDGGSASLSTARKNLDRNL